MKRILFVSVLVAALAVPAAAISSTQGFSSSSAVEKRGDPDFAVEFEVLSKNGHPKKVVNFKYRRVDLTCESGGPIVAKGKGFGTAASGPNGPAKVENGEFSKRYASESQGGGEGSFKVTGKFKDHNTKVKGTINVKGDFPEADPDAIGCKSGNIDYVAGESR